MNILAKAEIIFKDESIKVNMCNVPLFYKSNSFRYFVTSLKMYLVTITHYCKKCVI